jgi:hypothetical protein
MQKYQAVKHQLTEVRQMHLIQQLAVTAYLKKAQLT